MKIIFYFFLFLLFSYFIFSQNCYNDLTSLSNNSYPSSDLMHDATGKGDYGFFQPFGGYFDPGKWTVCNSRINENPGGSKYCYIHLNTTNDKTLTVAGCVPKSCSAEDLNTYSPKFVSSALHLPVEYYNGFTADCSQPSYDIPWGTWILVSVYIILISLLIIGTLYDAHLTHNIFDFIYEILKKQNPNNINENDYETIGSINSELIEKPKYLKKDKKLEDKHSSLAVRLLLSFSFLYNYSRLIAPSPPGSFDVLNGIRVIAMMFVVIGHTFYFFWDTMAIMNFQTVAETVKLFRFQIVVAGFYAVDTFFFLSGFLVSYLFIKELKGKGLSIKMMIMFYFHRIYRLTPSLIIGMFFFYLITPYWNNGPYWIFYQEFVINRCSSGWWYTIMYVQNLVSPKHLCMGWSWYLADDMQFYVLSPLILIAYWKNKYVGWGLSIIGILVCMASNLGISVSQDLQEFPGFEFGAELGNYVPAGGKFGTAIYLPPWTRVSPYLIGFICAFILLERGISFKITRFVRALVYINSFLIMFILSFITWTDSNYGWLPWMNYVWITICRPIWSVGLGALIIVCVVGYGGIFTHIMSKPFWVPLARLSYGAYIFHLINLGSIYSGYKEGITYTFGVVLYFFFGHLIIAFLLAFANYFLVEKPLMNIESLLLRRQRKKE